MFANYFLTAWRNLLKNRAFSAINIIGLAVGLASCILIMLYVKSESGYDQWIPDNERIVRLHTAYESPGRAPFLTVRSAGRMMPAVRDYLSAEIEDGMRLVVWDTTVQQNGEAFSEQVAFADSSFFNVLNLPFANGSAQSSFNKPNDLLISREMAQKYFGSTDAIGKTLTVCCLRGQTVELTVSGVLEDLPDNTHLALDMLVYMDTEVFGQFPGVLDTWTSVNVYTYFKLRPGVSLEQAQLRLTWWVDNESPFLEFAKQNSGMLPDGTKISDTMKHKLMRLPDLHLDAHNDAGNMGDLTPMGNRKLVATFSLVAVLILVIACINFMNLATARAGQRAKEVAMRKVLGASRAQVAVQFLLEAIGLVMISLLFALVAVELVLPWYNQLLGKVFEFRLFSEPSLLFTLLGLGLLVGLIAGSYPALVLSGYLPGQILKASKSNESSASVKLRHVLVVFQFAVSVTLLVCTAVVYLQTQHANNLDLGYSTERKLVVGIRAARDNLDSLKQQWQAIPGVQSVVYSSEAPTQDNENNNFVTLLGSNQGDKPVEELLNYHNMDYGFFQAYQVQPLAGRLFDKAYGSDTLTPAEQNQISQAAAILNEGAVRRLGFNSPQEAIGRTLQISASGDGLNHLTVVGVIPDIYFRSVKFAIRPSLYMLNPQRFNVATITYNQGQASQVTAEIERVWKQAVPMQPIDMQYLSDMLAAQYQSENVQMQLFSVFSLLAVLVACLGLYGLAAFTAERKTREIGIRKVMGASVKQIMLLLIWQFSRPIMLANLVAWPLSIWLMLNWLQVFVNRIDTWWLLPICLMATLVSVCIAWLTVGGNAAKVAKANPIKALRHE
ncbi:ABC transporter permease [Bowmanella yangjiangensis]|uniref:ABC transporter permease n=1 Tax=Bowmanella yangjiangensis TaxID=2811230 RepID=A0ABS3CN77_9ALTE|nr:ABC transporter permease [Bowmanella yangjiangensis]MBN7818540.1 ABC transporter permease [Bowmanella yangjiangensis]